MATGTHLVGERWRKPAREITDRAARYRANAPDALPPGERRCIFCGARRAMDVCHLDGHEKNTERHNLSFCCRSCNVRVANVMRGAGLGTKTRQYNPREGAKTVAQWVTAVLAMKGESDAMPVGEAVDIIRATPHAARSRFAKEIWKKRRGNPEGLMRRAVEKESDLERDRRYNPEGELKAGDLVKVRFSRFGTGERLWVRVTGKKGSKFTGVLDNEPVVIHKELGDKVKFSSSQIVRDNPRDPLQFISDVLTRKQKEYFLAQYDYWLNVEGATEEKSELYALKDLFKKFPRLRKKNPDEGELREAERLYETFHGREPREILEMQENSASRGEYTALGDLIELTMIAPTGDYVLIKFARDGVRVASSPSGEQLYLLGGNQDISGHLRMFGADDAKDLIDLGEAKQIVYEAAKWQTDFTSQEWKHDFGEESGVRPRGFYDQLKKRIFFAGGTYQVKRPGIVD